MSEKFYSILTEIGKAKVANSALLNKKLVLTTMKIGDGNGSYYNPSENQTDIVKQVYSGSISSIEIDEKNPNWVIAIGIIPGSIGGFYIREVGLFDDEGDLIAIGKYPETYKPSLEDGATNDLRIRTIFEVSNVESVTLKINPSIIFATKDDINNLQKQINENRASLEDKVNNTDIVNNLTTEVTGKALDAVQGKKLNEKFANYLYTGNSGYGNSRFGHDVNKWPAGIYNTVGGQTTNLPSQTDGWGTLINLFSNNENGLQYFYPWNGSNIYVRRKRSDNNFTSWEAINTTECGQGSKIQSGTASISCTPNVTQSVGINFPKSFSNTPTVIVTHNGPSVGRGDYLSAESISETGFMLYYSYASAGAKTVSWIAIG